MTLTEVSFYSRKFAPFAVLLFLMLLIFYFLIRVLIISLTPPPQSGAVIDPVFGKIKKPFLENVKDTGGLEYSIDTIEGKPITSTDSAEVYFLPASATKFGYREKIYLMAKTLGFDTEVVKHSLDGKEAVFGDSNQSLRIDITNLNFTYEYNFEKNPQVFENTVWPQKRDMEERAAEFLRSVGRYPEEFAQGKTNTIFITYTPENKEMKILENNINANLAEVDFYRPDQGPIPIVAPDYFNSQNYVMIVPYDFGEFKIIKAQIRFFEKSTSQIGSYPVKTGDAAWEDLKSGKGMLIQNSTEGTKVVIKKMFVGYLDPDIYQEYLQPVYVFLGDNFVAYVPALTAEYFTE